MEKERPTLEEIFHPRGVAVVGVSPSRGWANTVVQSLKKAGFPAIYPVNPKYNQILELPCYASIRNIPGIVDHVIVSIPAQAVLALLDDCIAKGVKSVHFFTAGFTESGYTERADLERTMLSKAKAGGPFVWRVLFDGTTNEGPYGVSAVIGKPRTAKTPEQRKAQRLLGELGKEKFWPVKLAFFPNASRSPEPEYELAVGMHPTSVARGLVMDYGSFVIDAKRAKIEMLPKASC